MKKIKTIISAVCLILLFIFINFLSIIIFSLGFKLFSNIDINSEEYVVLLADFLNKYKIFMVLLSGLILLPIFKKNLKEMKINFLSKGSICYYILLGIFTSLILNIIMYDLGLQNNTSSTSLALYTIIATGVLGPVLEEIVFRGIIYNKLKKSFSSKYSVIIVSLLFSLFHLNLIQGIYVFFFSLVITYYYDKTNNFLVPVLIHVFGNLAVSFIYPYLININLVYCQLILVLLIIVEIKMFKVFLRRRIILE